MRLPKPLRPGAVIGVTAVSSGVAPEQHDRLDLALEVLRRRGFKVIEGDCLREHYKSTSAPAIERAADLMKFLTDPEIDAVMPPWGGQRAIELLPLLDFERLKSVPPKWFCGFSDVSTLHLPLALISQWATLHGPNLMELAPPELDANTAAVWDILSPQDATHKADAAQPWSITQKSSPLYQEDVFGWLDDPTVGLNLTEPTRWQRLDQSDQSLTMQGRLIGGCLDTLSRIAGTPYGDVPGFIRESGDDGTILYLENVQLAPLELLRAFKSLEYHGWFAGISGLLIGRNSGPDATSPLDLSYQEVLHEVFDDMPHATLYDVDVGHKAPQICLVNRARAQVEFSGGAGSVTMAFNEGLLMNRL